MRIQETPLHCMKCKHEWLGEMILDAAVEISTAAIKAFRCPACGADARSIALAVRQREDVT